LRIIIIIIIMGESVSSPKKGLTLSSQQSPSNHITITTHPQQFGIHPVPIQWGNPDPKIRGPVIGTLSNKK